MTRTAPRAQKRMHLTNEQSFQTCDTICSAERLLAGSGCLRHWPRLDGSMGKIRPVLQWERRLRISHATQLRHQRWRRFPLFLLKLHQYVGRTLFWVLLLITADRFYGATENQREREMDMREMVDKVKRGEPLYGKSSLSPYLQGVASRNSRYSGVFLHVIPWFNFVNHNQVMPPKL